MLMIFSNFSMWVKISGRQMGVILGAVLAPHPEGIFFPRTAQHST